MYDLRVPVVGTVLTPPEKRLVEKTHSMVTSFRVVMNYRRYDRATQQWHDSGMFRIRVSCWRNLANHVFESVKVGQQVIVVGRIFTREWTTETGELRVNFEMEADAVGHDLTRGTADFTKIATVGPSSTVEDEEAENRIGGELAHLVDANGLPLAHDPADGSDLASETAADALAILREGGMPDSESLHGEPVGADDEDDLVGSGARRRRGR